MLYRAVLDRPLRQQLDTTTTADATERGRAPTPAEALADDGITRQAGSPP